MLIELTDHADSSRKVYADPETIVLVRYGAGTSRDKTQVSMLAAGGRGATAILWVAETPCEVKAKIDAAVEPDVMAAK